MNNVCKACGYAGENLWRDNNYYCASCGAKIEETQNLAAVVASEPQVDAAPIPVSAMCPICKNVKNNTAQNGKCNCALCGATFTPQSAAQQQSYAQPSNFSQAPILNKSERQKVLEKQKNDNTILGFVCLFLFWPAAIYFFYKVYQITQELSNL